LLLHGWRRRVMTAHRPAHWATCHRARPWPSFIAFLPTADQLENFVASRIDFVTFSFQSHHALWRATRRVIKADMATSSLCYLLDRLSAFAKDQAYTRVRDDHFLTRRFRRCPHFLSLYKLYYHLLGTLYLIYVAGQMDHPVAIIIRFFVHLQARSRAVLDVLHCVTSLANHNASKLSRNWEILLTIGRRPIKTITAAAAASLSLKLSFELSGQLVRILQESTRRQRTIFGLLHQRLNRVCAR
jgi:hypothetical protein